MVESMMSSENNHSVISSLSVQLNDNSLVVQFF